MPSTMRSQSDGWVRLSRKVGEPWLHRFPYRPLRAIETISVGWLAETGVQLWLVCAVAADTVLDTLEVQAVHPRMRDQRRVDDLVLSDDRQPVLMHTQSKRRWPRATVDGDMSSKYETRRLTSHTAPKLSSPEALRAEIARKIPTKQSI